MGQKTRGPPFYRSLDPTVIRDSPGVEFLTLRKSVWPKFTPKIFKLKILFKLIRVSQHVAVCHLRALLLSVLGNRMRTCHPFMQSSFLLLVLGVSHISRLICCRETHASLIILVPFFIAFTLVAPADSEGRYRRYPHPP